jgi:ribosomal protein S8
VDVPKYSYLRCQVPVYRVKIFGSQALVILLLKKENYIYEFQKVNISCKFEMTILSTLYYEPHKNDKNVDLSMHILKSPNLIIFRNTKNLALLFCTPVGTSLSRSNIIFHFFQT